MELHGESLHQSLRVAIESDRLQEWETFVSAAHPVIAAAALRILGRWNYPRREDVDDLVQEVYLRLCGNDYRSLRGFRSESPGALVIYLRAITSAVAMDGERRRRAGKRGAGKPTQQFDDESAVVHTSKLLNETDRKVLHDQIHRCLSQHSTREKQIFWLYYRHGLTSQAISAIKAVALTTSGVESLVRRLTISVKNCLQIDSNPKQIASTKGTLA